MQTVWAKLEGKLVPAGSWNGSDLLPKDGGWSFDNIFSDIGDFFSGGLGAAERVFDKYMDFDLKRLQASALSDAAKAQQVTYPTSAYPPGSGPFANVSPEIMILIAAAAVVGLVLLRK